MGSNIVHGWAARDLDGELWFYSLEPLWNVAKSRFIPQPIGSRQADGINEDILSMFFIGKGESKEITISVTSN